MTHPPRNERPTWDVDDSRSIHNGDRVRELFDGHDAATEHHSPEESSVPPLDEQAPPRYAVAYWLASLIGELTSAELGASDCLDDADELIAELRNCGLDIVHMAAVAVRDWRQEDG